MRKKMFWGQDPVVETPTTELAKAEATVAKLTVETVDNHVYFYAGVDSDRCLALMRTIRELDATLRNEHISRSLPDDHPLTPIWLHVNSGGGSLFDALGVADQLRTIKTPILSVVEGCVASSATVITAACTKRFITPSSFMLIHQVSGITWGTYEQIKDVVVMLDMLMDRLIQFYAGCTNMGIEELQELLKRDSWFDAQHCLENGLVDALL